MALSPTQLTLGECKKRKWRAQVVEKYNHHTRRRHDLWGWGDVIVLDGQPGCLLIQTTIARHAMDRARKIMNECAESCVDWLEAGNRASVWGWKKQKLGGRQRWVLKEYPLAIVGSDG